MCGARVRAMIPQDRQPMSSAVILARELASNHCHHDNDEMSVAC